MDADHIAGNQTGFVESFENNANHIKKIDIESVRNYLAKPLMRVLLLQ
jgi:hypothetical protein